MRQIAISDIHGCNRTFHALLEQLGLTQADELYLLGDYIDRGPDSRGVIDTIRHLQRAGYPVHCLRGNHEELLLEAMQAPRAAEIFALNGGNSTLTSFGVDEPEHFPDTYLQWINGLPYYLEAGNFLLVHAGFDFSGSCPLSNQRQMAWIRNWYEQINYDWLGERFIVHGHTPVDATMTREQLRNLDRDRVIDIDTGCVFAPYLLEPEPEGKGRLCAFDMTNRRLYFEANREEPYGWR